MKVINDFSAKITFGLLRGKKENDLIPSTYCTCEIDSLSAVFTPVVYNHFCNLKESYEWKEDDEPWKELLRDKKTIMSMLSFSGIVRKRSKKTQLWHKFYCILSGGYLYFYEQNMQQMPSYYYYLCSSEKELEISDAKHLIGVNYTICLSRKGEDPLYLAFSNEDECQSWVKKLWEQYADIAYLRSIVMKKYKVLIFIFL